ncbi:DUF258 domain-containing protein [Gossypium australe]|uniref:DUF258 domain-containing protein n=1 Tax=Gossypium australe TaxID=47621 RepID=A0A5B6V915_9ROSI|nr:DUF258 domain-containing protein [Gossypium australe]
MLTRFLVEAESTDLPLTFAFNKTKLVDEEVRILMLYYSKYTVGDMGVQQAEPQLEPKKHRRQSRKKITSQY